MRFLAPAPVMVPVLGLSHGIPDCGRAFSVVRKVLTQCHQSLNADTPAAPSQSLSDRHLAEQPYEAYAMRKAESFPKPLHVFLILTLGCVHPTAAKVFKLGLLCPFQNEYDFSARTSASAVSLAIEAINNNTELNLNGQIYLTVTARDTECSNKQALGHAVDLWYNESVDAFLGPPCSSACRAVAEIASVYSIPMISWVATDANLNDRQRYSTLSRTLGPFNKIATFLLEILLQYNWRRVVIISSNHHILYHDAAEAIVGVFTEDNITIAYHNRYGRYPSNKYIIKTLKKASLVGRIILLINPKEDRRRFILAAFDLGMCDGEFVFYTLDMLPDQNITNSDQIWKGSDERDDDARKAFESVFHVTLAALTNTEVTSFRDEVGRRNTMPPWNFHPTSEEQGDKYSPFLHDAVLLYALALSAVIKSGGDATDGATVVSNMRGRVFSGVSGKVVLDDNGDREPDFWITDMDPKTGAFVKVAEVINYDLGVREFRKDIRQPQWPNGKVGHANAPPDTPSCGFNGELCEFDSVWAFIVAAAVFVLVVAAFVVSLVMYSRNKFETSLLIQTWRIDPEDVEFVQSNMSSNNRQATGRQVSDSLNSGIFASMCSLNKSVRSMMSNSASMQQFFTNIGYYRGAMVAIKKIQKDHIQLSRIVLLEFNAASLQLLSHPCTDALFLKALTNSNLNVFVGASITLPGISLYWQYCIKGSLLDLLNNDSIRLDDTFKVSFMTDIAKGMVYLHRSHIVSHGRLKSSNCLVDSRWMIKVTDYGLPTLLSGQLDDVSDEDMVHRKMLWTAPEILRENVTLLRGSQPGDVYSFAIICYEILTRKEPYSFDNMTPRDMINRIRTGESTPFRPTLPEETDASKEMVKLTRLCWDEEPDRRPTFINIKAALVKMTGGEINILDSIIKMVEKYSINLEEIVGERTLQIVEEKKRTDLLLYKILPMVAEQLKAGLVVTPENFRQSSIYFSDIVGFTTISADSTPMQIVDFLNDLYTCFDDVLAHHDVYKVETVGDAYMVVSGVPLRNGTKHVTEIANCSLDLLSIVTGFTIRHRPHIKLQLRIGVHTGAVVTGVVGLMMPRYCLFGDTVTTAAKMESTGKPLRIHISKASYQGLRDANGGYETMKRGEMNLTNAGTQTTYWLYGKKGFDKPLPIFNRRKYRGYPAVWLRLVYCSGIDFGTETIAGVYYRPLELESVEGQSRTVGIL
ncbi:hypothetical protein LSH36_1384g00003 [Paralvinella palmiformis]|uniref:Guanylate cyclase n=1 Tax=Paralvinella palmiformis TaxID=53620 RepID=A0AAD9MQT1_9ANNE|nr:hypothetical protein LSH36_1384g00003 [Paralvinella palmiformis]